MSVVASAPGTARGYVCIVVANLLFAIGFSFVAAVDEAVSVWHLMLLRGAVFALALLPWALRHPDIAKGHDRRLLLLRGALGTVMIVCLLFAITALPLTPASPANVVTVPLGAMRRTVLLPESATKTFPAASMVTPVGWLKRAADPAPSALPAEPGEPARVVTAPAEVMRRTVLFIASATTRRPAESKATDQC